MRNTFLSLIFNLITFLGLFGNSLVSGVRLVEFDRTTYDNQINRYNSQSVEAADNIKGLHFPQTPPPGNRSYLWEQPEDQSEIVKGIDNYYYTSEEVWTPDEGYYHNLFINNGISRSSGQQLRRQQDAQCLDLEACSYPPSNVQDFRGLFDELTPNTCQWLLSKTADWVIQNYGTMATGVVIGYVSGLASGPTNFFINRKLSKDQKDGETCNLNGQDACGICETEAIAGKITGQLEKICQDAENRNEGLTGKRNSFLDDAPEYVYPGGPSTTFAYTVAEGDDTDPPDCEGSNVGY